MATKEELERHVIMTRNGLKAGHYTKEDLILSAAVHLADAQHFTKSTGRALRERNGREACCYADTVESATNGYYIDTQVLFWDKKGNPLPKKKWKEMEEAIEKERRSYMKRKRERWK